MNRMDRDLGDKMIIEDLNNMDYMVVFSVVAASKRDKFSGYAMIRNFTCYKLFMLMKDKMPFINRSSINRSINHLVEIGVVELINTTDKQGNPQVSLIILGNYDGFIKSSSDYKTRGYIKLHHCFFSLEFYMLPLRAKKLALQIFMKLNNESGKKIKMNFKSKKNPKTLSDLFALLKVNRYSHIKNAINELRVFFNIVELDNNTFEFGLNEVSSKIVGNKERFYSYTKKQLEKIRFMIACRNSRDVTFRENQIKDICEVLQGYNKSFAEKIVSELCLDDRSHIYKMKAYVSGIISRVKRDACF